MLEAITFRRDVQGRAAWQEWVAVHGNEGRKAWKEQASFQVLELAKTNLPVAKVFLDKAMYRWKDPLMLSTMQRLVEFKPVHSEIVGWINLTYGHHPHLPGLRDQLRALALRIQKESGDELEDWAKRLMQEWDFLYEDKTTWEQFIRLGNRRV